jgi:hypothetical protein
MDQLFAGLRIRITSTLIRVQLVTSVLIQLFTSMLIRIQIPLPIKVMQIYDYWSTEPPGFHF